MSTDRVLLVVRSSANAVYGWSMSGGMGDVIEGREVQRYVHSEYAFSWEASLKSRRVWRTRR